MDLRHLLDDALTGRYQLSRELGRGGMATVYLAQDLKHDRLVAMKVLHPELASTLGPERFLREIRITARLQHPHILPVLDSGETAGQLWYSMPYIQGESLRARLHREGQLPISVAVDLARQVAVALDYAHREGVVHRDLKPENILLSDGQPLLADFGVAKLFSSAADERLTETGMALGTPAYMSPEQATGGEVDGRSDVYALGCVLYEMLAGEPPFTGPTARAILAKRILEPVPHVRTLRESVPEAVEQTLTRALAKAPADRMATAGEFARALNGGYSSVTQVVRTGGVSRLRRGTVLLALAVVGSLGLFIFRRDSPRQTGSSGIARLAVLPFENIGDSADAYFADGVTDAVRDRLAGVPGIEVIGSTSSAQYRQPSKAASQIGHELNVRYLLIGKVRWAKAPGAPSRVQVRPELIDVQTGTERWGEPFDAALTDVFQVQADVAAHVARALGIALGRTSLQTLAEKPTAELAAYDAYLKGQEVYQSTSTIDLVTLRRAIAFYEQAVTADTSFALAWAQLARARAEEFWAGAPIPELGEAARQAAERALALAPTHAEGHLALGTYFYRVARDNKRALAELGRGQRLAPDNADVLTALAYTEEVLGRWESALRHLQRAKALDPRSVLVAERLGSALLALRRPSEALDEYERGLAVDPMNMGLIRSKMTAYLAQGDLRRAQALIATALNEVDSATVIRYVSEFGFTAWVLTEPQQRFLLHLTPAAFDSDTVAWGLACMKARASRGRLSEARVYAESVRAVLHDGLGPTPTYAPGRMKYGLALAYLGRHVEAIAEAERAVSILPIEKDAVDGAWMLQDLSEVYMLAGKRDAAVRTLARVLTVPFQTSPAWLRIDPTFGALHDDPQFKRLQQAP